MRALEKGPLQANQWKTLETPYLSSIVDEAFDGFLEILDQHSVADLGKGQVADDASGAQFLSNTVS